MNDRNSEIKDLKKELSRLQYFETLTIGLWATDKPEVIPEDLKNKYFWEVEKITTYPE